MSSARNEGEAEPRRWRVYTSSLAFRLGAFYLVLFLASFGMLLLAADRATRVALEAVEEEMLQRELRVHRAELDRREPERGCAVDRVFFLRVSTPDDRTLYRHGPPGAPSDHALRASAAGPGAGFVRLHTDRGGWTVAAVRLGDDRVLQIGLSAAFREATLRELRRSYAWILGTAAFLAVFGGVLLAQRTLRPVRELAAAAQRVVREGDFAARVPRRGTGDELDRLARSFNEMLAHNERLVRGMRDALDHVAHDLRTPLTRLRATAELALRDEDPAVQREALSDVLEEVDRVLSILRTLTDIGEADSGAMHLEKTAVELGEIAREVVDLYSHVAEEAGVALRVEVREPVTLQADRVRIQQALANLVDNAVKYTRAGGEVAVEVVAEGSTAVLRVRDTGVGIPEQALPRIWERLYRADSSRSQRGLGLGLSFVQAIVRAHGGEARVSSVVGRGSIFELRFAIEA